jgi:hypothetical protein
VMQQQTNVFILELNVLIMIFVPLTNVTMEFVIIQKRRIVMITILALLILVMLNWDANILL